MSNMLKDCPFCGLDGETLAWRDRNGDLELIEHPNTDCVLADFKCYNSESWNTRHTTTDPSKFLTKKAN